MDARNMSPKEVSRFFGDYVNGHSGSDFEEVAKSFVNEHRTLQQAFFRLMYCIMKEVKRMGDAGYYDLRNEASYKFSCKVIEMIEKENIYFPYV